MKLTRSELEIGNLRWTSMFLLFLACFIGLMGLLSDWEVMIPFLTLMVGFSIGLQASRILKVQDRRISELERKIG